jgi:hypothetical protein
MELIDHGLCQIVNLMNVFRPQGAPYFPEIAAKVVARYQFAKPPGLDDLSKDGIKFQIGKFRDVQIAEFGIYNDGIIVNGKCPTELLEEFMADVLTFSGNELGFIPILRHRDELHFESNLFVQSKADLAAFVAPTNEMIARMLEEKLGLSPQIAGFGLDFDPGAVKLRRKPSRFFIERKLGFKYEENIFLCIAPLKSKDFLELLTAIEQEILSKKGR